jgi:hypothetical protein
MKIGILTLPLSRNYGGILQAFALHRYLTDLGHNVHLIDRRLPREGVSLKEKMSDLLYEHIIETNTRRFAKRKISPRTQPIYDDLSLKSAVKDFDAVIVGSDQVWRLDYSGPIALNLFLDFVENDEVKRISYAASFGLETWNHSKKITEKIGKLLKRFHAVSVREDAAVKLCKSTFDVNSEQTLDPTLLLHKDDYIKLIDEKKSQSQDKVLTTYILDESAEKMNIIEQVAQRKSLTPRSINVKERFTINKFWKIADCVYPDVSNWLNGFKVANFVITDSFHGVVFSIIFKKQFIAIGNIDRGLARFKSILNLFGLSNRLIFKSSDLSEDILSKEIDFDKVHNILYSKRREASLYLEKSLE